MKKYEHITDEQIQKYEYLVQITQRKINYISEDLAQCLRLAICRALTNFKEDKGATEVTYVSRVLANEAKYYLRTNGKFRQEFGCDLWDEIDRDAENPLIVKEINVFLNELVTPREAHILELRYVFGLTYAEIHATLQEEEEGNTKERKVLTKSERDTNCINLKRETEKAIKKIRKIVEKEGGFNYE